MKKFTIVPCSLKNCESGFAILDTTSLEIIGEIEQEFITRSNYDYDYGSFTHKYNIEFICINELLNKIMTSTEKILEQRKDRKMINL